MSIHSALQKIGLSEKEAKIYLATLELGQASVQQIANKAKVNRVTAYPVLEALTKKGFVSTFEQDNKNYYIASEPESLKSIFNIKRKELEESEKYFDMLLPDLKLITNTKKDKPTIKFYEGKNGILNCFIEFYKNLDKKNKNNEKVRIFYNNDLLKNFFNDEELKKFRKVRLKNKIQSKVMYKSKVPKQSTPDGNRVRITGKELIINCDISIYADKMMIATYGKKISAIMIQNKDIVESYKTMFDLAWDQAKSMQK